MFVLLFLSAGLALGLGIGALAEVAKKSIRHNNGSGKESKPLFRTVALPFFFFFFQSQHGKHVPHACGYMLWILRMPLGQRPLKVAPSVNRRAGSCAAAAAALALILKWSLAEGALKRPSARLSFASLRVLILAQPLCTLLW